MKGFHFCVRMPWNYSFNFEMHPIRWTEYHPYKNPRMLGYSRVSVYCKLSEQKNSILFFVIECEIFHSKRYEMENFFCKRKLRNFRRKLSEKMSLCSNWLITEPVFFHFRTLSLFENVDWTTLILSQWRIAQILSFISSDSFRLLLKI